MKSHSFVAIGMLLLVCGGVVMAGSTFGFSTVAADRGVSTTIADNQAEAYLGVESAGAAGELRGGGDTVLIGTLTNNVGGEMTISSVVVQSVTGEATADDLRIVAPSDGTVLGSGTSNEVLLECVGEQKYRTQTVTVGITEATQNTVAVTDATFTVEVDLQCQKGGNGGGGNNGGGPANFAVSDVQSENGQYTQQFEFNAGALGNKDEVTIDLSDAQANAGVDYRNAQAEITSGQGSRNFEFDAGSSEIRYTAQGNVDGVLTIEVTGIEVTGSEGGTVYYTDSQGRTDQQNFSVPDG